MLPSPVGAVSIKANNDHDGSDLPAAAMPIVAVRSMGLGLASVIGVCRDDGHEKGDDHDSNVQCIVSPSYLEKLVRVADERFSVNRTRTERFRAALVEAMGSKLEGVDPAPSKKDEDWEDAEARRARKREEGLRRQAALREKAAGAPKPAEQEDGNPS